MGTNLLAYLLPVAVIGALAGICLAIYPDASFQGDLMGYLPVALLVFYLFAVLWMTLRKEAPFAFVRAVFPPIAGGIAILVFVAVPVFTGNAFRYRDAFGLKIGKVTSSEGGLVAEGVLEIRKAGRYQFTVPHFCFYGPGMWPGMGPGMGPEAGRGTIVWGEAGEPGEGKTGSYPLQIRWEETALRKLAQTMPPIPGLTNMAIIEVRDPAAPQTLIYSVSASLSGPGEARK
jgi:energy-coupling factor transporter transmembrane protein EcfT